MQRDKDLLVGFDKSDDAGVYKISGETAVVATLDFFPPIVDDPFLFGQIAAANALSDVYAMGGAPRFALNIVCFPKELGMEVLTEIIRGAVDRLDEAGAVLAGGHSIEDREIKFGLSVTGFVHPEKVITNAGARPGDVLVLTKPLGTGIITSALKKGNIRLEDAEIAFTSMKALNRAAAEAMIETGARACTDITGYGLMGHAMEMAKASNVNLVIASKDVPFFPKVLELVKSKGNRPRTLIENMEFMSPDIQFKHGMAEAVQMAVFDPQTSGGLLISIPEGKYDTLSNNLTQRRVKHHVIGSVVRAEEGWRIRVE